MYEFLNGLMSHDKVRLCMRCYVIVFSWNVVIIVRGGELVIGILMLISCCDIVAIMGDNAHHLANLANGNV